MICSVPNGLPAVLAALLAAGCYDLELTPFAQGGAVDGLAVDWAKRLGGPGEDAAIIDAFATGELAVAGTYEGSATFAPGEPSEKTVEAGVDTLGGFVALYDQWGTPQWIERLVGSGDLAVHDLVALDWDLGGFGVVGEFGSTLTIAYGSDDAMALSAGEQNSMFLARFDHTGQHRWAVAAGTSVRGLAVSGSDGGDTVVAGSFTGSAYFRGFLEAEGPPPLEGFGGRPQAFVAAYASDGALRWVKQTQGEAEVADVAVEGDRVYATGWFSGTTVFGPGESAGKECDAPGKRELFIAAYDIEDGRLDWVHQDGGGGDVAGCAVAIDPEVDAIMVAGSFEGNAPDIAESVEGTSDVFVARYDLGGASAAPERAWVKTIAGNGDNLCADLALLPNGDFIVAGNFSQRAAFPGGEELKGRFRDGFIARYDRAGQYRWANPVGGLGERDGVSRISTLPNEEVALLSGVFGHELRVGVGDDGAPLLGASAAHDVDVFLVRFRTDLPSD